MTLWQFIGAQLPAPESDPWWIAGIAVTYMLAFAVTLTLGARGLEMLARDLWRRMRRARRSASVPTPTHDEIVRCIGSTAVESSYVYLAPTMSGPARKGFNRGNVVAFRSKAVH